MKSLKSALKFWQEIVYVIPIGLLLIEVTKWVLRSQALDGADIFLFIWFLPLFVCLIGQFFWENEALAATLSVLLGLSSGVGILMALYGIFNSPSYRTESIAMLIIGIVCVFAACKMFSKYDPNRNFDKEMEPETISNNEASSKNHINRENFTKKHKGFFIIGLTSLTSLAFWLTVAYFDEGYNRFPVDIMSYCCVVLYALFFPIIPVVLLYFATRSSKKRLSTAL
jgi:FtsH-binding integral membrane protein